MSLRQLGAVEFGVVGAVFLFAGVHGAAIKAVVEDLLVLSHANRRCFLAQYPGATAEPLTFGAIGRGVLFAKTTPVEAEEVRRNMEYNCLDLADEEQVVFDRVRRGFDVAWKRWEAETRESWATEEAMAALVKSRKVGA